MAKKKAAGAAPAINIGSHISSTLRCASRSNRRAIQRFIRLGC